MEINATPEEFLNWLQAFHRRHRYLLLTFGGQGKLDLRQQKWNETIRYIAVPSGKKGDSPRDGIGIIVDIQYPANSEAIDIQIYPIVYSHEWRSGISGEEAVTYLESIGKTDAAAYLRQLIGAMEQKWMPTERGTTKITPAVAARRELIRDLYYRTRSDREIAAILGNEHGIFVSESTVGDDRLAIGLPRKRGRKSD